MIRTKEGHFAGGNFSGEGNFSGGNLPGGICWGAIFRGGNLPGGNFPSAVKNQNEFELLNNLGLVSTSAIIFIALDFLER